MIGKKGVHWLILFILIITPLWFFTNLTRNPYFTQITLLNVALIIICMIVFARALKDEKLEWKKTPIDIPLMGFLFVASLSIVWAWISHPYFRYSIYSETVKRWIYLVINCYAAYYIAVLFVCDKNRKKYLDISIAVGMIACGYGIIQYFGIEIVWPKVLNPFGGRSVSTFGNPNFLSSFLVLLLPLSLHYLFDDKHTWRLKIGDWAGFIISGILIFYLWMTKTNRDASVDSVVGILAAAGILIVAYNLQKGKCWYLFANILCIGTLLCTLTRSSWLGAIAAMVIYFAAAVRSDKLDKKVVAVFAVVCILTIYFWPASRVAGYSPTVAERVFEFKRAEKGFYQPVHQRLLIWRCAVSMIQSFPVIGIGLGNFELFYPFYQGKHMHGSFFKLFRTHANNTHNEVFEILSQVGVLGSGFYVLIIFSVCIVLWKNRAYLFDKYSLLPLALFAGTIGMIVDNLLNVSLHFAVPGFQYWWQLGILMGMLSVKTDWFPIKTKFLKTVCTAGIIWGLLLCIRAVFFQISEVHFFKGFKFSKRNQLKQAAPELEKARKFHRLEVNINYELGNTYARQKNRKKALFAYEEALKANAGYDEIYYNMAAVYLQMGDDAKGIYYYEKALNINPLTLESYLALGNTYLKNLEKYGKRLVELYKQGLEFYPENKDIWNNLGYVYTKANQHELAVDAYAKALSIDKKFILARKNLVVALKAAGKTTHPLLERENKLREIDGLVKKQDFTKAMNMLDPLLQDNPDDPLLLIYKANIQFNTGSLDQAEKTFNEILKIDPQNITALNNLGITYLHKGNNEQAKKHFETVISIEPKNKIAKENLARLQNH